MRDLAASSKVLALRSAVSSKFGLATTTTYIYYIYLGVEPLKEKIKRLEKV